jgi:tetratricopeptide (TPR) repeat protein
MKKISIAMVVVFAFAGYIYGQSPVVECQSDIQKGRFESALQTCAKAAETNALLGKMGRGVAYSGLMQWDNAIADLTAAIAINGRAAELFLYRANAYYQKGDYRAAYSDFERAAGLEPRLAARIQPQMNHTREMAELTNKPPTIPLNTVRRSLELSLNANSLFISRSVKKLNKESEDSIAAVDKQILDAVDEALKVNKYNSHAYSTRAGLYNAQEKIDLALFEYAKAILTDPKPSEAYSARADIYRKIKNYPFALADLNKVIELDPKKITAYSSRGRLYEEMGDAKKALADYAKMIELEPGNTFGYSMRAHFYFEQNDLTDAFPDIQKILQIAPKDVNGLLLRCRYHNAKKEYAAAIADCTTQ